MRPFHIIKLIIGFVFIFALTGCSIMSNHNAKASLAQSTKWFQIGDNRVYQRMDSIELNIKVPKYIRQSTLDLLTRDKPQ